MDLPRAVGVRRAKEIVLTGLPFSAAEAADWGMVNRVVPSKDVLVEATSWAQEIAKGPRQAMAKSKELLRLNRSASDLPLALRTEAEAQEAAFGGDEFREGLSAHLEKRDPCFPD